MINKVTLIGNLGGDPEIKHLENGTMVGRFSLATNENYKDKEGNWQKLTEWHNVVVWRDLAERAEKSLKKGMAVYVEGKISYRKYTDKDGVERNITDIVAASIRSLERREDSGGSYSENRFPSEDKAPPARPLNTNPTNNDSVANTAPTSHGGNTPSEGDDLPF